MGKLDGRVAIVTGAASGIGRGIAEAFGEEGAAVAVADKNEQGAQTVAEGIAGRGGHAISVRVDVTDEALVAAMVERVLADLGGVDVLVNNAGIDTVSTLVEMPLSMWQQMMDVNLTSLFLVTRAVLPTMIGQRSGRIINLGSQLGLDGTERMVTTAPPRPASTASRGHWPTSSPRTTSTSTRSPPGRSRPRSSRRSPRTGSRRRGPRSRSGASGASTR